MPSTTSIPTWPAPATAPPTTDRDHTATTPRPPAVTEITDQNWDTELKEPTFMMFYAPWCGHCKVLAPKLKKAAKALGDVGIKVGACDVEPNRGVQSKFPDIKGFPTLKFVTDGKKPKKALDYNGEREVSSY